MAVDIKKLSLSRVLNKAREIFTPIAQRNIPLVQSMNLASKAVNTPLNVNLGPFRGAYNSVNRALKQPASQFGQSIINTSNKLVNSPLGIPGRAVMGYGDSLRENITRAGQAYEQNTQLLNEGAPLRARIKPLAMGGWNTAKALAQVTPIGALKPTVGMALPGLLNAGIAKYQGQDPARAFGRGVAEYQGWRPILNVTDPAISKVASKLSAGGRGLSRLGKLSPQQLVTSQVATRGATGIGNVIEDEILARLDQRKITNKDRAFSFGLGAAMGGNEELLKQADFTDIAKKLKVPVKQVQEIYDNSLARKITVTDNNGKTSVGITDKRGSGEWIKWASDNGYDYKIELTGGSLGSVGGGQKPPDPLEALKVDSQVIKEYEGYKNSDYYKNKDNLISSLAQLEGFKETPTYKALDRLRQERGYGDVLPELSNLTKRASLENVAKVAEAKAQKASLDGFTDNLSPMQAGKVQTSLDKPIRFDGEVMAKRDYVRRLIADGYEVDPTQNRLYKPGRKDVFQEVSKTEADYARHLANQSQLPKVDPLEALKVEATKVKTGQDLAAAALKSVGQDPNDAYLSRQQLQSKYKIPEEKQLQNEIADISKRIEKLSNNWNSTREGSVTKMMLDKLFGEYTTKVNRLQEISAQSQLPKSEAIKGKAQSQPPELTKQVAQTTSSPSLDTTRTGNIPTTQVKQAQTLPIQQDSRLTGVDTKLGTNQNLKIKTTKVSSNESIPPTLKPKTQLLKQAEELRNTGFQELIANRELAQLNQVKREMFTSKQIEDINRLKAIARSNKALEGDIETLRKLTPDGLTDKVLEYVEEATAIKGQGNEEQLLETALSLPTKADTKVKLPVEIKNARELEKQASKLRDLVYNSETDPNIKAKAVADNQKVIQKSAISDYKEWEKQLFKQESAKRMTPNRQATIASSQIRTSTKPEFAKPESIAKTQDISNAGKGMTDIYRNVDRVFGKDSQVRKQILAPFDTAKASMVDDLEREATGLEKNIVKKYGFTKGSAESEYIQKYGEGLVTKQQLVERFGKKNAEQIVEANTWFRSQYDRLLDEVNAVRARIYPNNPEKQIPKRKDYYRHFQDLSSSLAGLKNLFENPAGIEPGLAGVSEYTVPKSKWLSFAQKRLGMKTEYDAVGGYLDYVGSQTYAKRIDPFIEKFRTLRQELVDATSVEGDKNYGKLNNFIEFLDDYANDLAGKTNPADRVAQKYMGRKVFKILNWVNSRTKANVIVGNLSSSIAQFFNIPQGIAEAGVVNSGKGAVRTLGSILDNTNTPITKSEFIKTRFSKDISDRFDVGVLSSVKKAASWITGVGDEIGTKLIWNSVYEKAISQNIENPIKYADDITRKMVAGRGIGEVPLLQKSKVFQLVAPFQLEVSNVWHVMREWAGEKAANKFVTFFIASYLMNRVAEQIRGSDVSIDPIQTGIDAIEAYGEEDDKKIGVLRAGGRVFGEILSNVPGGQTIAAMYPEYGVTIGDSKLPTRKKLFGEGDPTRFGSGLLASKGLSDPLYKIIPPFGGAQIKKTIEGLGVVNKGYSESRTGRVRFPVENSLKNKIQAGAFGQYSVPEAREYFDNENTVMGEKQSSAFKSLIQTQGPEQATSFYNSILTNRGKGGSIDVEGESSSDLSVIQAKFDNSPQLLTSDEIATYYESRVTQPKSTSAYESAVYENDIWKQVSNINSRESLTQTQKDEASMSLLSKIGVTPEDYKYHVVAKQDNDIKSLYAEEEITKLMASGVSREEIDQWLVENRKEVDGKQVLTSGVIDYLVDQNILSYSQGKELKSIKVSGSGAKKSVTRKSSKAKKPKKISFKAIKPPKVKIVKSTASSYFKAPKIKRVRIKKAKKLKFR